MSILPLCSYRNRKAAGLRMRASSCPTAAPLLRGTAGQGHLDALIAAHDDGLQVFVPHESAAAAAARRVVDGSLDGGVQDAVLPAGPMQAVWTSGSSDSSLTSRLVSLTSLPHRWDASTISTPPSLIWMETGLCDLPRTMRRSTPANFNWAPK